jgi:hypothetical protein
MGCTACCLCRPAACQAAALTVTELSPHLMRLTGELSCTVTFLANTSMICGAAEPSAVRCRRLAWKAGRQLGRVVFVGVGGGGVPCPPGRSRLAGLRPRRRTRRRCRTTRPTAGGGWRRTCQGTRAATPPSDGPSPRVPARMQAACQRMSMAVAAAARWHQAWSRQLPPGGTRHRHGSCPPRQPGPLTPERMPSPTERPAGPAQERPCRSCRRQPPASKRGRQQVVRHS